MVRKKEKKPRNLGPITVIFIITLTIMIISFILNILGIEGQIADTTNNTLEMTMIGTRNIFSKDGIKFLLGSSVVNLTLLKPLSLIIISLITVSVSKSSGLLKHLCLPLKKLSTPVLIFITLLVSIILTFLGEYSFILVLPFVGAIYKYAGRNPMLGTIIAFIGLTCGYGTGIIYNYDTYFLGTITQLAASIEVDPAFTYDVLSCSYIMIASTFIITFIATIIINKYLVPKYKKISIEEDEKTLSNKALWIADIITAVILALTVIMILPGGVLLDNNQPAYIAKLMSSTAPFKDGIITIFLLTTMVCSAVYGKITKNITNKIEYNISLYEEFYNVGYVFVLMFFTSVMIGVLEWTNLGVVLSSFLIKLVSSLEFSGAILIIVFFIFNVIIGILIPSSVTKWNITAPLIVPLFMRANITPEFTQFIFSVSDGIGKAISPFFIYFVIMLGFLQKYNENNEKKITIFGTLKMVSPTILFLAFIWLLLIVSWNIIGLPLGIETYATM